jgi:hypothetical protein
VPQAPFRKRVWCGQPLLSGARRYPFRIDRDQWGEGRVATVPIGIGTAARQQVERSSDAFKDDRLSWMSWNETNLITLRAVVLLPDGGGFVSRS